MTDSRKDKLRRLENTLAALGFSVWGKWSCTQDFASLPRARVTIQGHGASGTARTNFLATSVFLGYGSGEQRILVLWWNPKDSSWDINFRA